MLSKIKRSLEGRGVVAAVGEANEVDQFVPIHGSRSNRAPHPQAMSVDEDAARRDLGTAAGLTGDTTAGRIPSERVISLGEHPLAP